MYCCVTSPPYFNLRSYLPENHSDKALEVGLELTPKQYVDKLVTIFREVKRVLREDGVCWINIGDSYAGNTVAGDKVFGNPVFNENRPSRAATKTPARKISEGIKPKDLIGIPWMLAFALRDDGWYLRQEIIWEKATPMPESVLDRCTKAHESVFLLAKSERYYFDNEAIKEKAVSVGRDSGNKERKQRPSADVLNIGAQAGSIPFETGETRNRRSVWKICAEPYKGAHFAVMPKKLIEPCILAGTSEKGCCPKCGKPWARIIERVAATSKSCPKTQKAHEARGSVGEPVGTVGKSGGGRIDGYSFTLGWQASCGCETSTPIPCTVLDPFTGSGTTGEVALIQGRQFIGTELNKEYLPLIQERIKGAEMIAGMYLVKFEQMEMEDEDFF